MNVIKQLEAYGSVQAGLSGAGILPELHGWPISADLAAHLLRLLRSARYDLVVEFGSGSSTAIISAELLRRTTVSDRAVHHVAFEHLPEHVALTRELLRTLDVPPGGIVHESPLVPYTLPSGDLTLYYDCQRALEALRDTTVAQPKILALVDGPPGTTGPLARYPALEVLLRTFHHSHLCIILDDFHRPDEREVVERWKALLQRNDQDFTVKRLSFEKGACQLDIVPQRLGRAT